MLYSKNIVYQSTDENQYRIQSSIIAMVAAAFIVTLYLPLLLLLCYDFAVRALVTPKLSPFYHIAKWTIKTADIAEYKVSAAPKRFATTIWLILSLVTLYSALSGNEIATLLLSTLLVLCISADALMNICVGCRIFTWMKRYNITITSLKE